MPLIDLNLGGVVSAGKPLPEGDYTFRIEDATVKVSKDGNSHNLKMKMVVTSEHETDRPHSENLNVQQSTLPFVKAFLCALWGVDDGDEAVEGNLNFDVDDDDGTLNAINERELIGAEIGAVIKHKTSDDGTFANVVSWFTV